MIFQLVKSTTTSLIRPCQHYVGEIWKQCFHSKNASNLFRPHNAGLRNLKTQQLPVILDLCFRKTRSVRGNHIINLSWRHHFQKASFSKCSPSTRKRKAGVFKLLRFEERFRKALFSLQISVDGRHNRRNKAAFSNFSDVVWMGS